MDELSELRWEAEEALERVWFVRSLEEVERTDITLSLRLHIDRNLFVQIFCGAKSNTLYMTLVEGGRRVFGIDREARKWHMHPYGTTEKHEPLAEGLEPKPILRFLSKVEELMLQQDLL